MDFELDDHAAALLEAAGAALDAEATPALIRAAWSAQDGREQVRKVWATLADLGVVGALVPEDAGGLGLDIGQVVPLLERTGYVGLPVPAVETIAFTAPLLAAAGHPALTDVLAGRCLVTVSAADGRQVPYGQQADLIVLPTAASGPRTPVTSGWGSGPRERSGWGGKVPATGWGGPSGWGGQPGW
ncbi:MAG: acyl-CoA dehydrogenase family protein, partial [Frankia sp.]|nr:acyl-CoA dehydrogenase family protein [Frankia sp.]